jgi:orotate phosphoribosyltransferase-like protein
MYSAKDYDQALLTPESVFTDPMDVVETDSLTPEQKMTVLKRWEANAKDLEVASSESMTGGAGSRLVDVGTAIVDLMKNETVDENTVVQVQTSPSASAPAP